MRIIKMTEKYKHINVSMISTFNDEHKTMST